MRTIKFRGKDKRSGEWFYGNLYDKDTSGRTHICTTKCGSLDVIPETVGQFTGLYDKNGTEIYEGDILVCEENGCKSNPLEVVFKHGSFGYIYIEDWFHPFAGNADAQFEIIGNIHDERANHEQ